ncbi:MAG: murein biosynthesis integral membrane protein MurJ [Planctomycetota bacterium]
MGLAREILFAWLYGVSLVVGALRAAQSVVVIILHVLTNDALNAAYLPLYRRHLERSPGRARQLHDLLAPLALGVGLGAAMGTILAAPWLTTVFAPGFTDAAREQTILFVRIMGLALPSCIGAIFFSLTAMAHGRFALSAWRAPAQSLGMIAGAVAAWYTGRPWLLPAGFGVAYAIHMCVGWLQVRTLLHPRDPQLRPRNGLLARRFWRTLQPVLLTGVVIQGGLWVENLVASLLGPSVVAANGYARYLVEVGTVIVGMPLGLAVLVTFGGLGAAAVRARLERIVPAVLVAMVPLCSLLFALADDLVAVLLQRGSFTASDVGVTATILRAFAVGIWAHVGVYPLARSLSALLRNRELFYCTTVALLLGACVNVTLWPILGPAVLGLAQSTYLVALFVLLAWRLRLGNRVHGLAASLLASGVTVAAVVQALPAWGAVSRLAIGVLVGGALWGTIFAAVPALRSALVGLWALCHKKAP